MKFLKLFLLFGAAVPFANAGLSIAIPQSENCIIPIGSKRDYTAQWPLVLKPNGELYQTEINTETNEQQIIVKGGEEVLLSCGPNYFKQYFREEVVTASCNGATGYFNVKNTEKAPRLLTCDLRVIEEVLDDVYGCMDTGSRFGYVDPTEKETFLLGEACYNMDEGKTRFVHFKLGDKSSNYIEKLSKNYLTSRSHPDSHYKIELFRGLMFDEIYERIRSKLKITKTPQLKIANFVDDQLLSNKQFQAVKKLGWNYYVGYDENEILETLKSDIKHLSVTANFDIYAGSHGIKKLHGPSGASMEVYAHNSPDRFPMPDLLWFVVKKDNRATAFGVLNDNENGNSLVENLNDITTANSKLCKVNSCDQISWLSAQLKNNEKLICCEVNDLRDKVQEIPVMGDVKEMLK